jgi:hypothetical protein
MNEYESAKTWKNLLTLGGGAKNTRVWRREVKLAQRGDALS